MKFFGVRRLDAAFVPFAARRIDTPVIGDPSSQAQSKRSQACAFQIHHCFERPPLPGKSNQYFIYGVELV